MKEKISSAIIGLTVADALGVPVEFSKRSALKENPVTGMMGYGTYAVPAGTWSDDTSMTLCLLDSLAGGLNYADVMKKFEKWLYEGAYTQYNNTFDVGRTCMMSIRRFSGGTPAIESGGSSENSNGNGSLMRCLPIVFYVHRKYGKGFFDNEEAIEIIHNISRLTHAHPRSLIACGIYISVAGFLIDGENIEEAVSLGVGRAMEHYKFRSTYHIY